jgi:hypothetical protein
MKAPLTGNSITERVQFTGLYVPEPQADGERDDEDSAAPREAHDWTPERLEA